MKTAIISKSLLFFILVNIFSVSFSHAILTYEGEGVIDDATIFDIFKEKKIVSKLSSIIEMINESLISNYLADIVDFAPRNTGTYGCKKAGQYIYQVFNEIGLETRYHNWSSFGNRYNPRLFRSQNIEGIFQGTDENSDNIIIFNAHYDSVKGSPGADDDGSGVAAVLACAYVLSKFDFNHTIKLLCFSGEEEGLLGSNAYSKELYMKNDNIIIEFNADMIGYAKTKEHGQKFRIYGTQDVDWYVDVIEDLNNQFEFNFNITRGILSEDSRGGSDYSAFTRYGYEAIAFFEGQWNTNMHTKYDNLENVNISYLTKTTQLIAASIAYISDMVINYPFVRIESPKKGNLYFEGREKNELRDKKDDQLRTVVIDDFWIWADILHDFDTIEKVEFYYNGRLQFTDFEPPYKWHMNKISFFNHRIDVIAYDKYHRTAGDWIDILYINPRIRD